MIWVIGSHGMLGSEISNLLSENNLNWIGTNSECDISDYTKLENFYNINETKNSVIDWIINCAAYTNVEKAEEEIELATKLNALGPLNIANLCKKKNINLIHISTDYVFDGSAKIPYTENDTYNPLGIYGQTKAEGEKNIISTLPNSSWIFRTAWLYGKKGKNFVSTMINLMNTKDRIKVVNDQFGTPTFTEDLAKIVFQLIQKNTKSTEINAGIYQYTNLGETSWYNFALLIYTLGKQYNLIKKDCLVLPCTTEEFGAKVKRPLYSVLSKEKTQKTFEIKIPNWETSLDAYLQSINC